MMLQLSLFLHVIAAIFWIGGMLFLTLVIVPFLSLMKDSKERQAVYQQVGVRFRFWGWIAIAILLVTGPINLYYLGTPFSALIDPRFYSTAYGRAVSAKLGLVFIIVISSLVHDFWLGPNARVSPRFSMFARIAGRGNLLIALLIVIFAVFIRTGGF
ncbi:MAG: DUF4149 domain-containing protein [Deltaproteobacteria bacterium]|nr:DUF4149 domain-containing protein [Deltaproteobacteria bacterium]